MNKEFPKEPEAKRKALLDAVAAIGPTLSASGPASEELGTLAPEAVAALRGAGMFRLKLVAEMGGAEADPLTEMLVLEELSHARKRNAPILAELAGYGSSSNAYRLTAAPEDGSGADICISAALQDADCSFEEIDYINAHGTSTYLNDKSETAAIKKVFKDRAYEIPVSSNKSMLGHLVASAASIELIISVLTLNGGIIPPTINYENPDPECDLDYVPNESRKKQVQTILSNSFAFGGQNASLVVKKFH